LEWNQHGFRYPDLDEACRSFETDLRARFPNASTEDGALIDYAAALHFAILLTRRRLSAPNSRARRTGPLYVQLPILVGTQLRCLRALGLISADSEDGSAVGSEPPESADDLIRRYTTRPKEDEDGSPESRR
jgi:hypothetical protein